MNIPINQINIFENVIGQPLAKSLLETSIIKNHISPAYIFAGPNGVGKKLTAMRFLEGLLSEGEVAIQERKRLKKLNHPDFLLVEPTHLHQGKLIPSSEAINEGLIKRTPPQIRLEQIREIKRFLSKKPIEAHLSMVIIEEVENLSESSANALLKVLEEPENGLILLITSKPERLLPTIKSRCQTIPFFSLSQSDLSKILINTECNDEIIKEFERTISKEDLFALSNGSPGTLIYNLNTFTEIPKDLWPRIKSKPKEPIDSLSLARDITEHLNGEQQIWLISLFQQYLWRERKDPYQIKSLEKLKSHIFSFVQPRLAWEITLLNLYK